MSSSAPADAGDESLASASDLHPKHSNVEAFSDLDALERNNLERMLAAERRFPGFLWANLGIAAALVIYYSWSGS